MVFNVRVPYFYEGEQSVSFFFVTSKEVIGQPFKLQFPGVTAIPFRAKIQ